MNRLIFIAVLPLVFAALSAHAQQPDYAKSGLYLGLGAGGGFEQFDDGGFPFNFDNGFVGGGMIGLRMHPHIAAEAQLEFGLFDADLGATDLETKLYTYTVNVKGYLLTGRVQPYLLAGVGGMSARIKAKLGNASGTLREAGFAARFGGGVDFWLCESISLGVASSYVVSTGDVNGLDYVSLTGGIQYRF